MYTLIKTQSLTFHKTRIPIRDTHTAILNRLFYPRKVELTCGGRYPKILTIAPFFDPTI